MPSLAVGSVHKWWCVRDLLQMVACVLVREKVMEKEREGEGEEERERVSEREREKAKAKANTRGALAAITNFTSVY